ncbi:MAG: SDR family NAD(P)-dependent oxidoreductase, partial [Opitutaceae bacterium]|nr:SDR family NAD(P)-dependent oxidoreductase [Opitutaceae bacterium]
MKIPADSLQGRVALVTGGGSGLGRASALLLAQGGAQVGVLDFNAKAAAGVVEEMIAAGGEGVALTADVSEVAQVAAAVEKLDQTWGRLDIVAANAGINGLWAPLED